MRSSLSPGHASARRPLNPECSPRRPRRSAPPPLHTSGRGRGGHPSGVDLSGLDKNRIDHDEIHAREVELYRALDAVSAGVPRGNLGDVEEVDVVITGGGLRGYYSPGALYVLTQCPGIRIKRIAGASAGAWCAAFYHSGLTLGEWVDTYRETQVHVGAGLTLLEAYDKMKGCFPPDAYIRCTGKVFVSITTIDPLLGPAALRNEIVSEFSSNEDLVQACIPIVSDSGFGRRFRGRLVADGSIINNHPYFRDGARRQVEIMLTKVNYATWPSWTPVDPCVEALVVRGGLEARRFLAGHDDATSIEWVDRDAVHPDPNGLGHRVRTTVKFSALLLAAAPCLILFLTLKHCSASFNSFLKRGIGVSGEMSTRFQALFVGLVLAAAAVLGLQATLLLMCAVATAELLRLHDSDE